MKYFLILFSVFTFGQASNQMVTFTAAQSLWFSLNAGQSAVTSNQCMTKNDALTKYNLSSSAMSAYANNQLVPRCVWVSGASYVEYVRTNGYMTGALVCPQFGNYVGSVFRQNGTGRYFTNSALTTPFNGNNLYYGLGYVSDGSYYNNVQIDNNGYETNGYDCGF